MRVVILEPAMDDLRAGRRFYARQGGRDMGRRFFETLSETIGSLSEHGGIHVRKFGFHRALAAKFPYSVYYDIEGDTVRVHAVVDNRRNPAWVEDRVAGAGTHAKVQRHGDGEEAWCVRERNAPGYGAGSQEARKPVVYLETGFVSALTGRTASDPRRWFGPVMRARHWRRRRSDWRSEVMDNPVFEMDDEFFEKEIMAPRRRLWARGGGTLHGVCEYLRKRHAERMARRVAGEPPNYQTTKLANGETDLARKGAEGDAV